MLGPSYPNYNNNISGSKLSHNSFKQWIQVIPQQHQQVGPSYPTTASKSGSKLSHHSFKKWIQVIPQTQLNGSKLSHHTFFFFYLVCPK